MIFSHFFYALIWMSIKITKHAICTFLCLLSWSIEIMILCVDKKWGGVECLTELIVMPILDLYLPFVLVSFKICFRQFQIWSCSWRSVTRTKTLIYYYYYFFKKLSMILDFHISPGYYVFATLVLTDAF